MTNKEWLLAELRCASLRARLIASEIDNVGIAIKTGEMSAEDALGIIMSEGIVRWCSVRMEKALEQRNGGGPGRADQGDQA